MCAGFTAAIVTNPLDVIKTRLQTAAHVNADAKPTLQAVVAKLIREDGVMAATRGLIPRMGNSALWGTCMVSAYEFLKAISAKPE